MNTQEREDTRLLKSTKEIWHDVQELLSKQLSKPSFESWIRPIELVSLANGEATIAVVNEFMKDMVSNKFQDSISKALAQVAKEPVSLQVIVDSTIGKNSYVPSIASISIMPSDPRSERSSTVNGSTSSILASAGSNTVTNTGRANLNNKYSFESYVVGSHNRFCHSAAMAVSENPGQAYNPLFLYGGVGLGKTHVMQAIGHEVLRRSPQASVRYISCERFTNELINSIRDDRMMDFRKRYRQVDVLLMDDIQFIQGKESTQEEFFHTFNALRDSGRQIVLSCDRPPKAISLLEERLRSRFEWGLIADMQIPDLETRVAILRKKCELEKMRVNDEIIEYIASLFTTNIRELEGALIRAYAYANMMGGELTTASLGAILHSANPVNLKPNLSLDIIIDTVSQHYQIEPSEMRSAKRSQHLALPRHLAMYLAHELMQMSFPRIGQAFSNRKHTSALYAHARIREAQLKEPALAEAITKITRKLSN
jgi:chromosomal replication initiator protein